MSHVLLDISRLISRLRHSTPSGVDRVEMAYARGLLNIYGDRLIFVAVHPSGLYGRPARDAVLRFLDDMEARWSAGAAKKRQCSLIEILPELISLLPRRGAVSAGSVYVQTSPHHLTNKAKVSAILRKEQARFLCFVHDLIPIEFPEYARPSGATLHRKRIETVAAVTAETKGAVLVNSAATGRAVQPWLDPETKVHVALLGTEALVKVAPEQGDGRPYFLCLGTIEPRKNHLLLLHLWRHFAETMPLADIPRLVIVGRRGWENEQILDMLERCPALVGHVQELSGCPDDKLSALLRGARALVMPSFAEGYGMPVAEALSVGTPVLCSDIAAMREVGGDVPLYLDALDGAGWKDAILDAAIQGPLYRSQMDRIASWHEPTWGEHMKIVEQAIESLLP
jgi:glycosyltransferase involved in cell wall biosynthesis